MGVHRVTSDVAKYYATRERVLGNGISLLRTASEKVNELDKKLLEELGDLAAASLPHSPGYAGKLMIVVASLFWALAGVQEKESKTIDLEDLVKWIEELRGKIEG